jgi:hypothetical protein
MLKFHNQNFSWRQLDISPEIIEANHPLELKAIIHDVVTLYEQTHLSKPIISLFDYKFDNLLSQEISFISKLDESFSAQFSFSLDESLALKQYFSNLLREKQLEYEKSKSYGKTLVSSISSLQILLGDLYFLDDELEEAAVYYKDGMQLLKKESPEDPNLDSYRLIRNQLKLAYLYEKRKQPEFAYLLYSEIVQSIIDKKKHWYSRLFDQFQRKIENVFDKDMTSKDFQLFYLPLLAKLQILEKHSCKGILERDIKQIEDEFKSLTHRIIKRNDRNILKDIKVLTAEFYSKVGDILYYKNSDLLKNSNKQGKEKNHCIEISHYACKYYKKAFITLILDEKEHERKFQAKTLLQILKYKNKASYIYENASAKYCAAMGRVLSDLGDVYFSAKEGMCKSCEYKICKKLGSTGYFVAKENYTTKTPSKFFWKNWPEYIKSKFDLKPFLKAWDKNILKDKDKLNNIELALFLYSLSIKFYQKANMNKQAALQITNILNVFKFCSRRGINIHRKEISDIVNEKVKNENLLQYLTSKAIKLLYMANDGLDMFEIFKRKKDFNDKVSLQYIQVDSEIVKIVILQKELELYLLMHHKSDISDDLVDSKTLDNLYDEYIISPYCINYSISARVHQLHLKAKLNWETFKIIKNELSDIKDENFYYYVLPILTVTNKESDAILDKFSNISNQIKGYGGKKVVALLELLVADSIFCYTKILRLIKTSNDSYIFNHKFFAEIYRRLARWTKIYEKSDHEKTQLNKYLENLLGKDFREHVLSSYYYQKAFLHYHKSIETHTRGRAYFNLLDQLYFIKGDFDDVQSHFNAAEERFMINNTYCYKEYLEKIKDTEKLSSLYEADNYLEKT